MKTLEFIEKIVCAGEFIDPLELHIRTRKGGIKETRQIIMSMGMDAKLTESVVSEYFGLNHSTAHHAKKVIDNLCFSDRKFNEKICYYRGKCADLIKLKERINYYSELLKPLEDEIKNYENRIADCQSKVLNIKNVAKDLINELNAVRL